MSDRRGAAGESAPWEIPLAAGRGRLTVRRPQLDLARHSQREAAIVSDAMAQLSDSQRAMIYSSLYLGWTTTQIAAELGTDDEVVKCELHRALHALRMTLQSGSGGR